MNALLFALICVIWGSTWPVIKVGLVGVPPFLAAALRFVLSAAIVGGVVLARRRPIQLTRNDVVCILSLGLLVFWLDYAAVYWAETRISSGLTAILFSTMPLMTALLSRFWMRREMLTRRKVAGIVVGIAGTAMLFWPADTVGSREIAGMIAVIAGALFAAINLVMLKEHGSASDSFVLNFFGMGLGAACLLVTSVVAEDWSAVVWSRSNVLAIGYLAIFGSVVAFSAYYRLVRVMDATVVSLSTLIIPIVALALGRVFLGETVTPLAIAGIVTTLAGVGVAIAPAVRVRAGEAVASA